MALLTQDELAHLTSSERLELISQLWDSLQESDLSLSDSQRAELDRRLATVEEDRQAGTTWESLKLQLLSRRSQ